MSETIKVGVLGAAGRMGESVCAAVEADPALTLIAAFDPNGAGAITTQGITIHVDLDAFLAEGPDVVVDFTVADMASFEAAFTSSNLLIAANFAISAVLMMRFAELAAPFFDTGEVIELHHDNKIDAPSGTAVATADRMAAASTEWAPDPTEHEVYPGARGGKGPAGIRVHSVRMRGMVAHQEVILGALGQSLTIRQDSYDRSSFMPGVVLGCKRIGDQPGVTSGLDAILDV
jgi:4-hydroxy-tetrahydrodipicolinate reductase